MRLTETERAENREALARMSLPQRLDHIFEYYKFPLVLILIAAVALGSVLYYRITSREKLLYLADYIEPLRTWDDCRKLRKDFYSGARKCSGTSPS